MTIASDNIITLKFYIISRAYKIFTNLFRPIKIDIDWVLGLHNKIKTLDMEWNSIQISMLMIKSSQKLLVALNGLILSI